MPSFKLRFLSILLVLLLFCFAAGANETVNINTADAETIAANLTGVGPARAEAIIAYRDANGAFASVDELTNVSGVGPATVDANRDRIAVD